MILTNLKRVREDAGLTMENMGELLGISKVAYWKIEHCKTKLSYKNALIISEKVNKPMNDIFLPSELTKSELKEVTA
jgi:DNA-binding XRE family transcriptional regulator